MSPPILTLSPRRERVRGWEGVFKMGIKKGLKSYFSSIEDDETKNQHLLAFYDFCIDLIEERYGEIPSEGEINPRFAKGSLSTNKDSLSLPFKNLKGAIL